MVAEQQTAWSLSLGRWYGVSVRIHMLFFFFAVLTFYFGWHAAGGGAGVEYYTTCVAALGILFASIFVHEVAHGFTAAGFGGYVESIEVFPWGGTSEIELPSNKHHQLFVHLSGPLTNLIVCLSCAIILCFDSHFAEHGSWSALLSPLQPIIIRDHVYTNTIGLIFWVNWLVFMINLLPVSPFDGGKIVRSIIPLVWPNTRTDQVYLGSMIVAGMTSIGLFILAWLSRESQVTTLIPMWLVLTLLGIIVFFGARRQTQLDLRDLEDLLENESNVYADKLMEAIENRAFDEFDEEREHDHQISDWLSQQKFDDDFDSGADESVDAEEQLDEILDRINHVGFDGLSEGEKLILMRASAKIRQEKQQTDF